MFSYFETLLETRVYRPLRALCRQYLRRTGRGQHPPTTGNWAHLAARVKGTTYGHEMLNATMRRIEWDRLWLAGHTLDEIEAFCRTIVPEVLESTKFEIQWVSISPSYAEQPDPNFPKGVDVDQAHGKRPACKTSLTYPASPGHGFYMGTCTVCGTTFLVPTNAESDDPRSVMVACQITRKHM